MKTIYKYPIDITETTIHEDIPENAKILHAGLDANNDICVWLELDTSTPKEYRDKWVFKIYGTGHILPSSGVKHIGTVYRIGFLWHVYRTVRV